MTDEDDRPYKHSFLNEKNDPFSFLKQKINVVFVTDVDDINLKPNLFF